MPRYVPKTYNNRRVLRIILGTVITLALSVVVLFLILFFIFQQYVGEGGRLEIPWLIDEDTPITQTEPNRDDNPEPDSDSIPESDSEHDFEPDMDRDE